MNPKQRKSLEELASTLTTDEERGFVDGESTEAIRAGLAEVDRLTAENERLRRILEYGDCSNAVHQAVRSILTPQGTK